MIETAGSLIWIQKRSLCCLMVEVYLDKYQLSFFCNTNFKQAEDLKRDLKIYHRSDCRVISVGLSSTWVASFPTRNHAESPHALLLWNGPSLPSSRQLSPEKFSHLSPVQARLKKIPLEAIFLLHKRNSHSKETTDPVPPCSLGPLPNFPATTFIEGCSSSDPSRTDSAAGFLQQLLSSDNLYRWMVSSPFLWALGLQMSMRIAEDAHPFPVYLT